MAQVKTSDIDHEVLAQEVSAIGGKVSALENRVSELLLRLADIEKVNLRLEGAALTTARALAEISGHWDAVYEAMRRVEEGGRVALASTVWRRFTVAKGGASPSGERHPGASSGRPGVQMRPLLHGGREPHPLCTVR